MEIFHRAVRVGASMRIGSLAGLMLVCSFAPLLASAAPLAVTGQLDHSLDRPDFPETWTPAFLAPVRLSGTGVADVAPDGSFTLPAGLLDATFSILAAPIGFPFSRERGALASTAGAFAPDPGDPATVVGSLGVAGEWWLGIFGVPPIVEIRVPLTPIGVGGSASETASQGNPPLMLTLTGGPFTSGTATAAHPPQALRTASGSDSRDAAGLGTLVLVSPMVVVSNAGVDEPTFTGFATLTLTFVPEPGTAALLGAGLLALGARARRRQAPGEPSGPRA